MEKETEDRLERRRYQLQCRHFTGIHRDTCGVGIEYASVRDTRPGSRPYRWPCLTLGEKATTTCAQYSAWTAEESAQMVADDNAAVERMLKNLAEHVCNSCGVKIEEEQQVGSCVYAKPCGHRIGQGKARK